MKKEDSFNPDISNLQALKIVTKGLIQWPISKRELLHLMDDIGSVLFHILIPIIILIALITLPISVPIFTFLVQLERKKIALEREKAKRKILDRFKIKE